MNIIGCDLHTRYQVVAWIDKETGQVRTRRPEHENGEARAFYTSQPRGAGTGSPLSRARMTESKGLHGPAREGVFEALGLQFGHESVAGAFALAVRLKGSRHGESCSGSDGGLPTLHPKGELGERVSRVGGGVDYRSA